MCWLCTGCGSVRVFGDPPCIALVQNDKSTFPETPSPEQFSPLDVTWRPDPDFPSESVRGLHEVMAVQVQMAPTYSSVLDKGIVIDAWVRVSLVGIDVLAVEARVTVASIETYLIP